MVPGLQDDLLDKSSRAGSRGADAVSRRDGHRLKWSKHDSALESAVREDPEVQELLDRVVAREIDPASAAVRILEAREGD